MGWKNLGWFMLGAFGLLAIVLAYNVKVSCEAEGKEWDSIIGRCVQPPPTWQGEWKCLEWEEKITNAGLASYYCMETCVLPIEKTIGKDLNVVIAENVDRCMDECYEVEKKCTERIWIERRAVD